MRESAATKAADLLVERRVTVLARNDSGAVVDVRGDTASHRVVHSPTGWRCDCDAYKANCSHVLAAAYVIDPARSGP